MKREEYLKYHEAMCQKMIEITKAKNHDYAGFSSADDPFANFTTSEKMDVALTEQGFLVRMLDKFSRINSFVKQGVLLVEDEKIEDSLLDLANYSILLSGYIKSKKEEKSGPKLGI